MIWPPQNLCCRRGLEDYAGTACHRLGQQRRSTEPKIWVAATGGGREPTPERAAAGIVDAVRYTDCRPLVSSIWLGDCSGTASHGLGQQQRSSEPLTWSPQNSCRRGLEDCSGTACPRLGQQQRSSEPEIWSSQSLCRRRGSEDCAGTASYGLGQLQRSTEPKIWHPRTCVVDVPRKTALVPPLMGWVNSDGQPNPSSLPGQYLGAFGRCAWSMSSHHPGDVTTVASAKG